MTTNDRITNAAWRVVAGDPLLESLKPGWCLSAVRRVIELGLHWSDGDFYRRYGVDRTTMGAESRTDWSWWAADIEASMKALELAVPEAEKLPGDLLFNHRAAKPYGHVGLYLGQKLVLEVVDRAYRPNSFSRRSVCVTPLSDFPVTLVARLPSDAAPLTPTVNEPVIPRTYRGLSLAGFTFIDRVVLALTGGFPVTFTAHRIETGETTGLQLRRE